MGVLPGMRLSGAWALQPDLHVQQRDEAREQAALAQLACWAGSFTSEVCLLPPQMLLLEVAGSLRLFGGAAVLFAAVVEGCREQGFVAQAALAPTPLAAQWLAMAGDDAPCLDPADLPRRLGALPLDALPAFNLSTQNHARLRGFGARSVGDALRLPRAGLARRLGVAFVTDLARALGELPDPRARFVFPERFAERLELPARVENALALGFAGRRLIAVLCGWLAARSGGISECTFEFEHERGAQQRPATLLTLGLTGATRNAERIGRVLIERLQRLELPAAVEVLTLRAESPEPLAGRAGSLFAGAGGGQGVVASTVANAAANAAADEAIAALVERLQARLGNDRVHGLAVAAEHRPESASQPVAPMPLAHRKPSYKSHSAAPPVSSCNGSRPLWLLPQPQALRELGGRPQRGGPLQLLAGPERIESGWWDAGEAGAVGEVRRDYFIVMSQCSEWLWIYRSEAGWFLHGFFS